MSYLPTTTTTGKLEDSGVLQLSGIILLAVIMLLFMVVMLGIIYRLYSRRHFYWQRGDTMMPTDLAAIAQKQQGLDPSILKSITVIQLSAADRGLECSVCLCDISQGDQARFLPKCNHAFHVHCIDTWFQSHSTCPLCRSPVSVPDDSAAPAVVVETMISLDLPTGVSSSSGITNDKHLAIDITSLGTQEGHKSPSTTTATLFRSLSRLLSRDRKLLLPSNPANIDAEQPPPSPN